MLINKQVERFITVAEKGSISEAARVLYLTQPALSKQIQTLEAQLGFPLFERTKTGVSLTVMGQAFYEDMIELILFEENAINKARALGSKQEKIIRMGIFTRFVELESIQLGLQNFAEIYPDAQILFIKSPFSVQKRKEMLLDGLIDVFWRERLESSADDSGLGFSVLFEDPPCIIVAEDHPFASREVVSPEDLYGLTLSIPKTDDDSSILNIISPFLTKRHPQIHLEINDLDASDYLGVQHGEKILFYGTRFAKFIPHIQVIPFRCNLPTTNFGFAHRSNPSNLIRSFIQTIQASF